MAFWGLSSLPFVFYIVAPGGVRIASVSWGGIDRLRFC